MKHGINKAQLKTVGRGSEMPIVYGGAQEKQAPNRRVEFYVEQYVTELVAGT